MRSVIRELAEEAEAALRTPADRRALPRPGERASEDAHRAHAENAVLEGRGVVERGRRGLVELVRGVASDRDGERSRAAADRGST